MRGDNRKKHELRRVNFAVDVNPYAEGSCEVAFGNTVVRCTATIEKEAPKWIQTAGMGWITAEYGMLPRSTHTRMQREASSGKQSGRTLEIQRLIGRALRAAVDLKKMGPITIKLDCDVLCADGGTRTAAITGGWVALYQAINWAKENGIVSKILEVKHVAAISVGKVKAEHIVDLCYQEDSQADFDLNIVMNEQDELIEIQGTAEQGTLSVSELQVLLNLGKDAIKELILAQKQFI